MTSEVWWKQGVVYQIYPRSFQDSDGDGIGDLEGIRRRLDYLEWLGVDAIWISPIYPSPMADFGYDVADYCGVHPLFGTLADFDRLVAEVHGRGMKLILDFVPNHSSDRHPWFLDSRSSRDDPKRDWYIWRDPKPDGGPPNNWVSNFGGPAWAFDEASGQFYLHSFLKEQPDLNWRNPEVREAMYDVLRFWLERGVDGFRVDVIWLMIKDELLRDNPPNPAYAPDQPDIARLLQVHNADQPEVHEVVAEMRRVVDRYPDRVLIGEIYLPLERLVAYYGEDLGGAHLPFNFQLIQTAWHAQTLDRLIQEYEAAIPPGGWPNWVLGNHDQPRIAGRIGEAQARNAALLLLSLRGTPTLYYGDELGIGRVEVPPEAVHDPWEKNEPGLGFGRDPYRTPFQWDTSDTAGFTTGIPWLPLTEDHRERNVERLRRDPSSLLNLYRELLAIRRSSPALTIGSYVELPSRDDVLVFERRHGPDRIGVAINFGERPCPLDAFAHLPPGAILLSTDSSGRPGASAGRLRPNEGLLLRFPRAKGPEMAAEGPWWQREAIYQIFVPSFQDSDGDGLGDLAGIVSRVDYLRRLGIGAVWLTPFYPTPFEDAGYDISDFTDVDRRFGDLATFDRLAAELHRHGLRLILDFVPNHSSDRHPWFLESRASRDGDKRDWYVWRDPGHQGEPPNNWLSRFGGSAWEFDKPSGQYYYHAFLPSQPDLNWRSPTLRQAMHEVLEFWLRRGVDGFRIDAAAVLVEDSDLRDEPPNPEFNGDKPPPERFKRIYTDAQPATLEYLAELRRVADRFSDTVLLGEVDTAPDKLPHFYGDPVPRLHLPLNYILIDTAWKAHALAGAIETYLGSLPAGAWSNWTVGSHDKPRVASRLGDAQARIAAVLTLTLPGTPVLYAGDEIGMKDVPIPPDCARDPFERRVPGYGLSRDPHRVPFCWDDTPGRGFTSGVPWLPCAADASANVASQDAEPGSLLNLYRDLIALRRGRVDLRRGGYKTLLAEGGILIYERAAAQARCVVVLNLSASLRRTELPCSGEVLAATDRRRLAARLVGALDVAPHEGFVIEAAAG